MSLANYLIKFDFLIEFSIITKVLTKICAFLKFHMFF